MKRKSLLLKVTCIFVFLIFNFINTFSEEKMDDQVRADETAVHIYVYDNVTGFPVVGATVKCYEYWDNKAPIPKYIYEEETDGNGHCKFMLSVTNYISYFFEAEKGNKYGCTGTYESDELPEEIEIIISPN
ncbi:MAG: hypothetical protein L6422_09820 [Candidatus Marinimicrobia bacterium]|nr:hypothetical protein [bacterium]MCG2716553.1 hypothetical protein [Candidatus Neomarinimicrobiota bacterium]